MDIASFLKAAGVIPAMEVVGKRKALQLAADRAEQITGLASRDVMHALLAREKLGSTAVGRGVAIPHARFKDLKETVGLFLQLSTPINFDAADQIPVDLVFVLLAPEGEQPTHVRAMARISRVLRDTHACEKIREAVTAPVIYAILTAGDEVQEVV